MKSFQQIISFLNVKILRGLGLPCQVTSLRVLIQLLAMNRAASPGVDRVVIVLNYRGSDMMHRFVTSLRVVIRSTILLAL